MKINTFLILVLLSCAGCRGVDRLLGQEPHEKMPDQGNINVDDYYITGTTTVDYQSVYLTVTGREVTVEVLRPNQTNWVTLQQLDSRNAYQIFTIPNEGIHFGDVAEVDSHGNTTFGSGVPTAPKGTQYKIHTVKK